MRHRLQVAQWPSTQTHHMKNIFVLYTGGTIGMTDSPQGLRPAPQLARTALCDFADTCRFTWHICQPLIDSSDIRAETWPQWVRLIEAQLPHHDGVLVLHGTDTLAYTANYLALHLNHHACPIVITGAMQPYGRPDSDAHTNLQTAIDALLNKNIQETVIAFDRQLYPAIGSSKCSTERAAAFHNPHFGHWQADRSPPQLPRPPVRANDTVANICCHLLTPNGNSALIAHNLVHHPHDAAILIAYGNGNIPNHHNLLNAIGHFTANGRLLLNISQVPHGCADATYAQSSGLRQTNAVIGGRCNIETAVPLMQIAVAENWSRDDLTAALSALYLK